MNEPLDPYAELSAFLARPETARSLNTIGSMQRDCTFVASQLEDQARYEESLKEDGIKEKILRYREWAAQLKQLAPQCGKIIWCSSEMILSDPGFQKPDAPLPPAQAKAVFTSPPNYPAEFTQDGRTVGEVLQEAMDTATRANALLQSTMDNLNMPYDPELMAKNLAALQTISDKSTAILKSRPMDKLR